MRRILALNSDARPPPRCHPRLPLIPFSVKSLGDSLTACKLSFLIASNFHSDSFLILFNARPFLEGYMLSQQWTDKSGQGLGEGRIQGLSVFWKGDPILLFQMHKGPKRKPVDEEPWLSA